MRKDLNMSPGKLAAQVGHCSEVYWLRIVEHCIENKTDPSSCLSDAIYQGYIHGAITKTICEARNKNHLLKAKAMAEELGLVEDIDFGLIRDNCLTELTSEDEDGRTTTGIWFRPLPDEIAHTISKKYQLYKG